MASARILVVDDEPSILQVVTAYLEREGFEVYTATDGPSALQAARRYRPDIIVLDIMLPEMDGLDVLTRLRRESDVYVILLTARTEEMDRVLGLSLGADDYVTKPFSPRELVARVKAALRRLHRSPQTAIQTPLRFPGLVIDPAARKVLVEGRDVHLTPTEFDLLWTLATYHGRVLSREELLHRVWGSGYYGEPRVVDVHIGNLRKKLGSQGRRIVTVRGVGYRFDAEGEEPG